MAILLQLHCLFEVKKSLGAKSFTGENYQNFKRGAKATAGSSCLYNALRRHERDRTPLRENNPTRAQCQSTRLGLSVKPIVEVFRWDGWGSGGWLVQIQMWTTTVVLFLSHYYVDKLANAGFSFMTKAESITTAPRQKNIGPIFYLNLRDGKSITFLIVIYYQVK